MKKLLLLTITLFSLQLAFADDPMPDFLYQVNPAIDCPKKYAANNGRVFGSEVEWADCNYEAFERADQELNQVYQKLLAYYVKCDKDYDNYSDALQDKSNPKNRMAYQLKEAQRSWIKFKDAQCRVVYLDFYGGTAAPRKEGLCQLTLTRNRLIELKKFKIFEN